ncbi:MAG: NAD-dependent protein deacetylase [Planctomycetes bacterium]|nr:NAD-dependent protein deacetylase [Planctomycetota bacterium]
MSSSHNDNNAAIEAAARIIEAADVLLIAAGAGMGVDSGLPDFRGPDGFWEAYPVFREQELSFTQIANPSWFHRDPPKAWGFYGHRLNMYREKNPHQGFSIIKNWTESKAKQSFIFTSNVDGHFQKSGFSDAHIYECHGSIHYLQCAASCTREHWSANDAHIEVDNGIRALDGMPQCPHCQGLARPNILMFGDYNWNDDRSYGQAETYRAWIEAHKDKNIAVLECGAGTIVPSVRLECEAYAKPGQLIRINTREPQVPDGHISIQMRAAEALAAIDALL